MSVVYKYRKVAVSCLLFTVLAALLKTYTTTPLYRARARVMIEMENDSAAEPATIDNVHVPYWQDPKTYYETQYRILTGSELARRVAQRLDLATVPEFNGSESTATTFNRILSAFSPGAAPRLGGNNGGTPSRTEAHSVEPPPIDGFLGRVSVEPVWNSRLVSVGFVSADPVFAALAANTLVDQYVEQNLELRRRKLDTTLEWLSKELTKQQKKVEDSERTMAQYREDQNALSLGDNQNIVVARLNQLNDAVTKAKTDRVQKEVLYDQIRAFGSDVSPDTIPAIRQNPGVLKIKTHIAELQRQKSALQERYLEKHPEVIKVNADLEEATRQLEAEQIKAVDVISNDYQSALAEERTLTAALDEQKQAALDLSRKNVNYTVLDREARTNRQLYETLLLRQKEMEVIASSRGNNVRVTDRAERPTTPFTPVLRSDLRLGIWSGIGLSLCIVFLLDCLNDTVRTPDEVTDRLRLPLLGLVPKVADGDDVMLSRRLPNEFSEALRALRTSLVFATGADQGRLVMVTSALPLEGKTMTACNLSLALAISGARVLLIDADMRRPGVHRIFGIENGLGVSDVLTGQVGLDGAVVSLENPRISVLTAGMSPSNPSELLGSDRMKELLRHAKASQFDWVILDTPPVLPVTDAVVLSPLVDGIAFIIGAEMTRRQHAARAVDMLVPTGSCAVGAVLNRVDFARNKRYYASRARSSYYVRPAA